MCIYICMCTDVGMHVCVYVTRKFPSSRFLGKFDALSEVTVNTLGK